VSVLAGIGQGLIAVGAVLAAMQVLVVLARRSAARATAPRPAPPPRPARPPAPPSPLTAAEQRVLEAIARRRPWASPQDRANARMIADGLRELTPHLSDADLGRIVLDIHGYMTAARQGAGDAWAMARMTAATGLAAVELTDLERETSKR
jgi:hypothetical protein